MGSSVEISKDLVETASRAAGLMAVRYFTSETSVTMFRATLARELVEKSSAARALTPNERFRRFIFPLKVDGEEILDEVNPIWGNTSFVLPAMAALAWLFDAVLSPTRHATFTPVFERTDSAIYKRRLAGFTVREGFDEARFGIMIAGACKAYYSEPDFLSLARWAINILDSGDADAGLRAVVAAQVNG